MITFDEILLPMRNIDNLSDITKIEKAWSVNNYLATEPQSTLDADANYAKADLQAVVEDNCIHLSLHEQNELLDLLPDFEDLFHGTLGNWNTEPVSPLN
jgi:hypothetical protein